MFLHRKVLPRLARELVRVLGQEQLVQVDPRRNDRVELSVAAALVDGLTELEALTQGRAELEKSGPGAAQLLARRVAEGLSNDPAVTDVFADVPELERRLLPIVQKYAGVDERLDRQIREGLTQEEGSPEWEAAYASALEKKRAQPR